MHIGDDWSDVWYLNGQTNEAASYTVWFKLLSGPSAWASNGEYIWGLLAYYLAFKAYGLTAQ